LLPAVQAAREAARRVQCQNNLKQIALGFLQHEQTYKIFPSGGWSHLMVGDPDRGYGKRQPGAWDFSILPFIEQMSLWQLGSGLTLNSPEQKAANKQRIMTPLSVMICPTRRTPILYPTASTNYTQPLYCDLASTVARSDYAANSGDTNQNGYWQNFVPYGSEATWPWPLASLFTGISFVRSEVKMADISDGASNTYLVGERYINADLYLTGQDPSDDQSLFAGWDNDNHRCTFVPTDPTQIVPPQQDRAGATYNDIFGSAHAIGFNIAFCDGSVQMINYAIDIETHRRLGNRKDGLTIDGKKW